MVSLAVLLVLAAPASKPSPLPTTPVRWLLGAKPVAGDWVAFESSADMVNFVAAADGTMKQGRLSQRTRTTFLYLGPNAAAGAPGEWLEIQEELLALEGDGLPAGMGGPGRALVTRALLGPGGKVLRTVVQQGGGPATESAVMDGMSVAIGALAPFEALTGKPKAGSETIDVAGLGKVAAQTHEATAGTPRRSTKIWRRASDGLCLRIVDATEGVGTTTSVFTGAGRGGATKIEGDIRR